MNPGVNSEPFYVYVDKDWENTSILDLPEDRQAEVIEVYKYQWWKKILSWFGFQFKSAKLELIPRWCIECKHFQQIKLTPYKGAVSFDFLCQRIHRHYSIALKIKETFRPPTCPYNWKYKKENE